MRRHVALLLVVLCAPAGLAQPTEDAKRVRALIGALDGGAEARLRALAALGRIGPGAAAAVQPLLSRLGSGRLDWRESSATARTLLRIGRPVLRALARELKPDRPPEARLRAARVIGGLTVQGPSRLMTTHAADVVPGLVAALYDHAAALRGQAASALYGIGPAARDAVPALLRATVEGVAGAAHALESAAPWAVDVLVDHLGDPRARIAEAAADALEASLDEPALQAGLARVLASGPLSARRHAVRLMRHADYPVPAALAALRQALADPDAAVRASAAGSLCRLGASAERLGANGIRALVADIGPRFMHAERRVAAAQLCRPSALAIAALARLAALAGPEQLEAIRVLAEVGPPAVAAVPQLRAALTGAPVAARQAAARALGRVGGGARAAVPALERALEVTETAGAAAVALWRIRGTSDGVVPVLIAQMGWEPEIPRTLAEIGAPAIPLLVAAMKRGSYVAVEALRRLGPRALPALAALRAIVLASGSSRQQVESAAGILGRMGPAARPALAGLLAALRRPGCRYVACEEALLEIGGVERVPQLIALLDDRIARPAAIRLLGRLGPGAGPAVPALVRHLGATDSDGLAGALAAIGPPAVPALVRCLADPRAARREAAAGVLSWMAELGVAGAGRALPALVRLLGDPACRTTALEALAQLGPLARPAVAELTAALRLPDAEDRRRAAAALGRIGPPAASATVALATLLDDPATRDEAAKALGRIGPTAAAAVPSLVAWLERGPDGGACLSLGQIGGPVAKAALIRRLDAPDPLRRRAAYPGLIALGPAARPALPRLLVLARRWTDRDAAVAAIASLGPADPRAEGLLRAALRRRGLDRDDARRILHALGPDEAAILDIARPLAYRVDDLTWDPLGHEWRAGLLAELGPAARPALPDLRRLLSYPHPLSQIAAAWALWRIEGRAAAAVAVLAEILLDPDVAPWVRDFMKLHADDWRARLRADVASRLGRIGDPGAASALGRALRQHLTGLEDEHPATVRRAAVDALAALGDGARAATADLEHARSDPDHHVRTQAARVLARFGR